MEPFSSSPAQDLSEQTVSPHLEKHDPIMSAIGTVKLNSKLMKENWDTYHEITGSYDALGKIEYRLSLTTNPKVTILYCDHSLLLNRRMCSINESSPIRIRNYGLLNDLDLRVAFLEKNIPFQLTREEKSILESTKSEISRHKKNLGERDYETLHGPDAIKKTNLTSLPEEVRNLFPPAEGGESPSGIRKR